MQIKEWLHLSTSLLGIPLRCDLFKKRRDQKKLFLWQQLTEYTILEIQFESIRCALIARISKNVEQNKLCWLWSLKQKQYISFKNQ